MAGGDVSGGDADAKRSIVFDPERDRVVERRRELFHDLVLRESIRTDVDRLRAGEVLAEVARRDPWRAGRPRTTTRSLLERLRFLQRWMPELAWPESVDALLGRRRRGAVRRPPELRRGARMPMCRPSLAGLLSAQQRAAAGARGAGAVSLAVGPRGAGRSTRMASHRWLRRAFRSCSV